MQRRVVVLQPIRGVLLPSRRQWVSSR
jgi:hypothetical protein